MCKALRHDRHRVACSRLDTAAACDVSACLCILFVSLTACRCSACSGLSGDRSAACLCRETPACGRGRGRDEQIMLAHAVKMVREDQGDDRQRATTKGCGDEHERGGEHGQSTLPPPSLSRVQFLLSLPSSDAVWVHEHLHGFDITIGEHQCLHVGITLALLSPEQSVYTS